MSRSFIRLIIASVTFLVLLRVGPVHAENNQSIVFGVFPYLPPTRLETIYAPLAADLSQAINQPVQLRTRPNFRKFREELEKESYDLIFIQPFDYVRAAVPHGFRSIARPGKHLKAVFVAHKESNIQTLADLNGQTIANPPLRAAVTLLGKLTIAEHGLVPGSTVHLSYQNSHAACLRQLLIRKAAACVTAPAPLKIFEAKSAIDFRVFAKSQAIPGSTYAVHKRVPKAISQSIRNRIISWQDDKAGQRILREIKLPTFVPSDDSDYDPVRQILSRIKSNRATGNDMNPQEHK